MPSRASRLVSHLSPKSWITSARLLLAAKTALAVGIAWVIAPLIPGVAEDYPYYAPLGALVSMTPTLVGSVRTGLQSLLGLVIGILLAGAVIIFAAPNVITISLIVGVGVLIAGSRWLTAGGDYVPIAALFVLIIGGGDAENYSIGYLVQMTVGVGVGLAVNFIISPPLTVSTAVVRLEEFRRMLAHHLDDMAKALVESWPPEHEEWATRSDVLRDTSEGVREALRGADESRKGNPRKALNPHDLTKDYESLYALESITFHVRDMTEVLAATIWARPFHAELPEAMREPLSDVLRAVGGVLVAAEEGYDMDERVAAANEALETALDRLDRVEDSSVSKLSTAAAVAMNARRIIAVMTEGEASPDDDASPEAQMPRQR
jgi:uncharacterized membrane protein YccC